MIASFGGYVDIVRALINAKTQVNTQDEVHNVPYEVITLNSQQNTTHSMVLYSYYSR